MGHRTDRRNVDVLMDRLHRAGQFRRPPFLTTEAREAMGRDETRRHPITPDDAREAADVWQALTDYPEGSARFIAQMAGAPYLRTLARLKNLEAEGLITHTIRRGTARWRRTDQAVEA